MKRKYDLYSQDFYKHSHQVFAEMRKNDPIIRQAGLTEDMQIWFITRFNDVEQVLLNDQIFARDPYLAYSKEAVEEFNNFDPAVDAMINNHMLNKEGADHRRLRSIVSKAFTPRVIQNLRPRIQEIAGELIDAVQERGEMELVSEYAYPLPITVIAEMLGIPREDRMKFRTWSNAVITPAVTEEELQERLPLMQEFAFYMQSLVALRRQQPQDDLLSGLIQAEEQGDRLSASELFSMLFLLIVAGHETTVTFIGNAVLALLQNPHELEKLKQDPSLMPTAVEELLRYDSPVERTLTRFVTQNVDLAGYHMKRGDMLIAIPGSANRDEARFEQPDRLNLQRQSNTHMAFGKGVHYCLGAPLARLEGEIALSSLFQRFPDLQLAVPVEELCYREVPLFHSLVKLPVRWK